MLNFNSRLSKIVALVRFRSPHLRNSKIYNKSVGILKTGIFWGINWK